ncbi:biotin--[acetyl-CoA-carboxylase] ligase [Clostridium sp. CCUG 7971]|uniref:biotin--[acetyl-CoA-carboxylase] ligase n=1 Tax=Clostridium sp. CCUG 7971 TaxID=2811414 RepID=UPI001ABA1042|nr:biotin--[acetyl-CoA-carboxylase] ligase [Clostridium sp. CCUG 7971]MBO3443953.1 biotin--[acetyl-CoA-carboxylase] ligase [Clostridium sp. CCUG 7971]
MKNKIIEIILNKGNEFISGEELSKQLGISRAGIWKHIKTLKEEGYNIESVNKKGYRLAEKPLDLLTHQNICHDLNTDFIGNNIIHFQTIDSTNDYAKKIASEKEDGTVIISEEQTKGKGRLGRQWYSKSHEGIWMSIVLKPNIMPYKAPFITLIAGASIVKALNDLEVKTLIKWPNDIILNGKKISGILTELSAEIERVNHIVLGMGINVKTMEFSQEICDIATSLYKEGYKVSRVDIVRNILNEFEKLYIDYVNNNSKEETLNICRQYSAITGKDIYILNGDNKEQVKCLDINEDGNLIVEKQDKTTREIMSGEVSIRGIKGYV